MTHDYTFRSVYMSLSTLLYFANQNCLVYIPTLYWLCTLVFEIYFSTLKHDAILTRVFSEKHPYTIKGQLFEELIEKVESVLKRMSWKAHFFLKGEKNQENTNHFGLSSNKTPPTILELKPFEEDVLKLLENIKFRDTKNYFQETSAND